MIRIIIINNSPVNYKKNIVMSFVGQCFVNFPLDDRVLVFYFFYDYYFSAA